MNGFEFNGDGMCWAIPAGHPQCDRVAEHHILWRNPSATDTDAHHGLSMTAVCHVHYRPFVIERTANDQLVAEHEYRAGASWCDMPGTAWEIQSNICILNVAEPVRRIRGRVGAEVVQQYGRQADQARERLDASMPGVR